MKTYKGEINILNENQVFVFGSNTEGRHGKGSAFIARTRFGAIYGQPEGMQGRSYGIITKNLTKTKHPSRTKEQIKQQIKKLYDYAEVNKEKEFLISYGVKKNLNFYTPQEMAEMFSSFNIPENIIFEENFSKLLKK